MASKVRGMTDNQQYFAEWYMGGSKIDLHGTRHVLGENTELSC